MRVCTHCGTSYPDDASVCPVDGHPLSQPTPTGHGQPSARAGQDGRRLLGGRYLLGRVLGAGGFGSVYEALDQRLQKRVAIKVLSPEVSRFPEVIERFQREAFAASQIGHKSIVDVTDFDRDADGTYFLVMELLDGRELTKVVQGEGPLPPGRVIGIALQVAEALGAAHDKGIVHRDLKPANIFLVKLGPVSDFAKILDFGISKMHVASAGHQLTATGQIMGTPHYMSPEQASGEATDGRTDIYALGVIVYEMFARRPPFVGETPVAVITQHLFKNPTPLSEVVPDAHLPPEADAFVLRAMAKRPEDRYQTMTELADALRALQQRMEVGAAAGDPLPALRPPTPGAPFFAPVTPLPGGPTPSASSLARVASTIGAAAGEIAPEREPSRRGRTLAVAVGVAALLAAGAALLLLRRGGGARHEPRPSTAAVVAPPPAPVTPPPPRGVDAAPRSAPATPASDPVATVAVKLVLVPPDAEVRLDGLIVADNPLRLPRSDRVHVIEVSAPGYTTEKRELRAVADGTLKLVLSRARRQPSRSTSTRRRPGAGAEKLMEDDL